jgi:hypothetical protein
MIGRVGSRRRRTAVPPHWFRPLNPDPHPLKPGEKVISKFKSKKGAGKFAVTVCDEQPDPAAILLLEDDDLDRDDD